ncbi:hypothetical protein M513_10547 [Trichuris suis]|uniref:DDE-1 domain-containing protein n=1 Tax=Trichuris suis TaxID=68888 RepID=A0A085LUG7_9BILA|nr:hypothetical protein M513_10547 [Trichuris suis]
MGTQISKPALVDLKNSWNSMTFKMLLLTALFLFFCSRCEDVWMNTEVSERCFRKSFMPGVTRNQSWIDKNESNRAEAARDFFKSSSLKHYCYMIVESWDSMKEYTLRSSWDKLIDKKEKESSSSTSTEEEIAEVLETMKALSISNGYDNSEIEMWLACDSEDVTFYMLSDNEIIKSITEREEESEEEGDQDDKTETRTCPCSDETFQCLEIALQWFERQRGCDSKKLFCMKNVSDLAALRRATALRQSSITV